MERAFFSRQELRRSSRCDRRFTARLTGGATRRPLADRRRSCVLLRPPHVSCFWLWLIGAPYLRAAPPVSTLCVRGAPISWRSRRRRPCALKRAWALSDFKWSLRGCDTYVKPSKSAPFAPPWLHQNTGRSYIFDPITLYIFAADKTCLRKDCLPRPFFSYKILFLIIDFSHCFLIYYI